MAHLHVSFDTPLVLIHTPPPEPGPGAVVAVITATMPPFTVTAKGPRMAYTLPVDKQVTLKVEFLDAKGNHATVDGDPAWSSSNTGIATAKATPGNPWLAQLLPVKPGNCQVVVKADADLGGGMREIMCTMDVTVVAGEAVVGQITPASDPAPPSAGGGDPPATPSGMGSGLSR